MCTKYPALAYSFNYISFIVSETDRALVILGTSTALSRLRTLYELETLDVLRTLGAFGALRKLCA